MQSGEETDNLGDGRGDLSVAETRGKGAEEGVVEDPRLKCRGREESLGWVRTANGLEKINIFRY